MRSSVDPWVGVETWKSQVNRCHLMSFRMRDENRAEESTSNSYPGQNSSLKFMLGILYSQSVATSVQRPPPRNTHIGNIPLAAELRVLKEDNQSQSDTNRALKTRPVASSPKDYLSPYWPSQEEADNVWKEPLLPRALGFGFLFFFYGRRLLCWHLLWSKNESSWNNCISANRL